MKHEEAAELVAMLVAATPTPAWPLETQRLYEARLIDCDYAVTRAVVAHWIDATGDRPEISSLRRAVAEHYAAELGCGWLPVDEAWSVVQWSLTNVGRYRDFPATHPFVKQVVDRFGWLAICDSENLDVIRGQFRALYAQALDRAVGDAASTVGARPEPPVRRAVQIPAQPPPVQLRAAQRPAVLSDARSLFNQMRDNLADKAVVFERKVWTKRERDDH
jgi:hypothetical protein